jgi:predicted esterase
MSITDLHREDVAVSIPVTYHHHAVEGSRDVVLFLHGYQDSASAFLKRILKEAQPPFPFLAPNAPFPAPVKTEEGYREGYSWFFTDRSKGVVLMPPEPSADAVFQIVQRLGLSGQRKILVGFSQGGYFMPFLARRLSGVMKMIGVGCGYRPADYEGLAIENVDAIHGDRDDVISLEDARKGYDELRPLLKAGSFYAIDGLKHGVDDRVRTLLMERISEGRA